jgi:adenine-specific DNA-methyltransferase
MSSTAHDIVMLAIALGGGEGALSAAECAVIEDAQAVSTPPPADELAETRALMLAGADPLGDRLYELRDAAERRGTGTVYTPAAIVEPMAAWVIAQKPARVVDAGCGSGRYAAAVARSNPDIAILAIDLDPIATLMTRATLAVLGAKNAVVQQADFTKIRLAKVEGSTAFIGNPPYLRHHQIPPASKRWAQAAAAAIGHRISGLAGLHAYFYLATAHLGRPGDLGCFVTSAEWLDVNYGSIIRNLLTDTLGGQEIHVIEPTALPFEGTATTAAIVQFQIGTPPAAIGFRAVPTLAELAPLAPSAFPVARERLLEAPRWSVFTKTRNAVPAGFIELGELARVHRGTVTGANATWVARGPVDLPSDVLYRSITRARELFAAGHVLESADHLKQVIDIPSDLDGFSLEDRKRIDKFLRAAKQAAVHRGYVAMNRRAWWSIGLKSPAPILATYMARRPPAFVRNNAEARHINIAHGLYPRQDLSEAQLRNLAAALSGSVQLAQGRTYAGGLTKFEPREMERLPVPDLATLSSDAAAASASLGLHTSH